MKALRQALQDNGTPITVPWRSLANLIHPVPGNFILVAGAPGAGKSMFCLSWALKMREPVSLVSLDTDSATQGARIVSVLSNHPTTAVLGNGLDRDEAVQRRKGWADWLLAQRVPLRVTDIPMEPEELIDVLVADTEYFGEPPKLVIIDDIFKMKLGARGYSEFLNAFIETHQTAKMAHTVIMAVHHLHRGPSMAGNSPVSMADISYNGEYEAEFVLGISQPTPHTQRVHILKNRNGQMERNGNLFVDLAADLSTVQISDLLLPDFDPETGELFD